MLKVNRTVIVLTLCTLACGQSAVQRSDGASTPVASPASMPAASPTASIASLNVIKRATFKVHSGLPPYTFNLVGKREKGKVIINGIEVTRDDDPSITQSLRVSSDITPLREDLDYFRSEDINFDGYEDISLLTDVKISRPRYAAIASSGFWRIT